MKIFDNAYGEQIIDNEIINTKEMQRLKGIHQNGTWHLVSSKINTTRFEHSLGVYFLLRKFNAPFEEQVSGLIHDISHFPFSHVIDFVFEERTSQEFAEKFHSGIIKKSSIASILKENNIDIDFILDKHNFKMLETNLPDICADRLDYFFRDSILFGVTNHRIVNDMINSLLVKDDEFIINNEKNAKQIAKTFLEMNRKVWTSPWDTASYQLLANIIKIALKKKIIKEGDFYLTDDELLGKLVKSKDSEILEQLKILRKLKIREVNKNDCDFHTIGKVRYIDPKFLDGNNVKRVSEVDKKFKNDIKEFQGWVNKGFYIKIIR